MGRRKSSYNFGRIITSKLIFVIVFGLVESLITSYLKMQIKERLLSMGSTKNMINEVLWFQLEKVDTDGTFNKSTNFT